MKVAAPQAVEDGVSFVVEVGFSNRECLVSKSALARLARLKGSQLDAMGVYRVHEDRIQSVARRLAVAGVSGTPLVLGASCFQ
jgi:hypothetical protein